MVVGSWAVVLPDASQLYPQLSSGGYFSAVIGWLGGGEAGIE